MNEFIPLLHARRRPLPLQEILRVQEVVRNDSTPSPRPSQEVVIDKFNLQMTYHTLECLGHAGPIENDIIDFYMCLLQDRDKKLTELSSNYNRRSSHFFNCYFIMCLLPPNLGYNYNNVRRWTAGKKEMNPFLKDKIFMPAFYDENLIPSWAMIVIFMQLKEIHYYDSVSRPNVIEKYLKHVLQWLRDESLTKYNNEYNIDSNEWQLFELEAMVPQQSRRNPPYFDSGMFSILCADFVSDNIPLNDSYSQAEIPLYRQKVCASILRGELNY